MRSATQKLLTIEEFLQLPDNEHLELVHGEVFSIPIHGGMHGAVVASIGTLLNNWGRNSNLGIVGISSGFILSHNPATLSGPDVYFVRAERAPYTDLSSDFWTIAPDLAVEVVSPSETAEDMQDKVSIFLTAGTPLVWVVYPRTQQLVSYTSDNRPRTYGAEGVLDFPNVLPEFVCKVGDVFESCKSASSF